MNEETDNCLNNSSLSPERNCSFVDTIKLPQANLWCLLLVLFPITCVFGNSLVVLAVLTERSLQTTTNYLLVSLAMADMLIAVFVMPFSVYLTINRLYWFLPDAICNFFCVIDVSASTSSIVHLVAISMDRFYAVVKHMEYKSSRHKTRVYCTILFCWTFSATIGLPLGIGLNQGATDEEEYRCGIVNPNYILYSSIFAFYIPCLLMIIMYSFVFYRLHKRLLVVRLQEMAAGRMINFGDNLGNIFNNGVHSETDNVHKSSTSNWAMPFLKSIEQTIANMVDNEDLSMDDIDELTSILHTLESDKNRLATNTSSTNYNLPLDALANKNVLQVPNTHIGYRIRRRLSAMGPKQMTVFFPKSRIRSLKDRAIELLMRMKSKQGIVIRKETRATKLVATVMVIFLLCYLPFFTTNIVKAFKLLNDSWTDDMEEAFIVFTWFGYFNSCLNPVIYSLFNRKFRATFRKLLRCPYFNNQNSPRKLGTGNLLQTRFSPTNVVKDQEVTYSTKNTTQTKNNRRLGIESKSGNSLTIVPEKSSDSKCSKSNSFSSNKGSKLETKLVENVNFNKRRESKTGCIVTSSDEFYVELPDTKINFYFTEAVEV